MLIDKINNCTSSINELSAMRTNALSLSAFERAVDKLAGIDAEIADYAAAVQEMNRHDFCSVVLSAEDIDKIKDAVTDCAAAVNAMTLCGNDVAAVSTVFRSQDAMLTVFWQSAAKAYVEPICSYLGVIQTIAANKAEISALIKSLGAGAAAKPSADIVRTLTANAQKASAITGNFPMSDGVHAFLEKVKAGGATYADITDDVAKWIKAHDLGDKIKLTF